MREVKAPNRLIKPKPVPFETHATLVHGSHHKGGGVPGGFGIAKPNCSLHRRALCPCRLPAAAEQVRDAAISASDLRRSQEVAQISAFMATYGDPERGTFATTDDATVILTGARTAYRESFRDAKHNDSGQRLSDAQVAALYCSLDYVDVVRVRS
jgi:hypothetical protein